MIELKHVSKTFCVQKHLPGVVASMRSLFGRETIAVKPINHVSFTVGQGEFVGLVGANGAGKTTLIKLMTGLLYPDEGSYVRVLGSNPYDKSKSFLKQISLVGTQKSGLLWDLSATEVFELQRTIYEIDDRQYRQTLIYLTELLACSTLLKRPVRQLSFGEKMKLELILALLHTPKVLFLDEPIIGLDYITQNSIRAFLQTYCRQYGATIILTSHNLDDIQQLCDRLLCLKDGRLYYDGSLAAFLQSSDSRKIMLVFARAVSRNSLGVCPSYIVSFDSCQAVLRVPADHLAVTVQKLAACPLKDMQIVQDDADNIFAKLFRHQA